MTVLLAFHDSGNSSDLTNSGVQPTMDLLHLTGMHNYHRVEDGHVYPDEE